jgi:hypothetical protein
MSFVENNLYQRIFKDIFINYSLFWLMVTNQVSDISASLNSSKKIVTDVKLSHNETV